MILRTLLLIAGLLVCLTINAEKWWQSQFKIDVDGIVYDIGCYYNTDDGTSVEYEAILYDGKSCFGDIVIPEEVTHFDSGGTYRSHLNLLRKYKMGDFCIFVLPQTQCCPKRFIDTMNMRLL